MAVKMNYSGKESNTKREFYIEKLIRAFSNRLFFAIRLNAKNSDKKVKFSSTEVTLLTDFFNTYILSFGIKTDDNPKLHLLISHKRHMINILPLSRYLAQQCDKFSGAPRAH